MSYLRPIFISFVLILGFSTTAFSQSAWEPVYTQDFGTGSLGISSTPANDLLPGTTTYTPVTANPLGDGKFAIAKNPNLVDDFGAPYNNQWQNAGDHTTGTSYMALFNANPAKTGEVNGAYDNVQITSFVVPGGVYKVDYYAANMLAYNSGSIYNGYVGVTARSAAAGGGTLYGSDPNGSVALPRATGNQNYLPWQSRSFTFTYPYSGSGSATLYFNFYNSAPAGVTASGNDLVIDDIDISLATTTVSGRVYVDNNRNGVYDAGDGLLTSSLPYITSVESTGRVLNSAQISAADGTYSGLIVPYSTSNIGVKLILTATQPAVNSTLTTASTPTGYAVATESPNPAYGTTGTSPTDGIMNMTSANAASNNEPNFNMGLVQTLDLAVAKSDLVASVESGKSTSYTVTVTNNGPSSVTGSTLQDPAATGLTVTAVTCAASPGQCTAGTTPTSAQLQAGYSLPALSSGQTYALNVTATVTPISGTVTNTVTITAPSSYNDTAPGNNSASDTDTVYQVIANAESGSAVSGVASTAITNVAANDTINGSPATLGSGGNATVATSGSWPAGITLNQTTDPSKAAVTVAGSVAPGTYTFNYSLCDRASPTPNCTTAPITVTVANSPPPTAVSDTLSNQVYNTAITLTTLSNDSAATGRTLVPATVTISGSSGAGQSLTVTGQGVWSVNSSTGSITFTPYAAFRGNPTPVTYTVVDDQGHVSNSATETVTYAQTPQLYLVKSANTPGPVSVGQVITYSFTVTNTGNVAVQNVSIDDVSQGKGAQPVVTTEQLTTDVSPTGDSSDGSQTGTWDTLGPGDTITFYASYTTVQADINNAP